MAGTVAGGGNPPAPPWPELRGELSLYPGPPGRGGEPTWTLHDPQAHRFFRLGWLEVEILNRWRLASPEAITAAIARETTLSPIPPMVETVKNFLIANNLVVLPGPVGVAHLLRQKRMRKTSLFMTVMKNYLFIRIPLVRPDAFLTRTLGNVRWVFTRQAATALAVAALLGLYLVGRQWDLFKDTFASLLSFQGGLMAMVALVLSKAVHELGHAYAAKLLGLRVPSMGVALMCFAPVAWTDTTEAWKLPARRDRLLIGASGVYAEVMLAALAALAWPVLPPGALKTAAFITASSTWVLTLVVNANPFMRYDGYYLLSDYWNFPGLQTRSFALAKWRLREWLFGFGLPPPEAFSRWDRFKLVAYAFYTWFYRFFLFLGIALLVYHLFFKALGVVLMLVELVFFISLPIWMEIMTWIKLRKHFRLNARLVRTCVLAGAAVFLFVYPWHGRVGGAALLYAERQAIFYSPSGGIVAAVATENGKPAAAGDLLFQLRSPDLDSRIDLAEKKITMQRLKLSVASLDADLRAEMAGDWDELERLAEDLGGLLATRQNLEIRAPFAGVFRDMPPWLVEESWVAAKEGLGILSGGGSMVQAFVSEADLHRVRAGAGGKFYPTGTDWDVLGVTVTAIESQALTEISYPELASAVGGPLAAVKDASGRLVPEHAVYRVLCRVDARQGGGRFVTGRVSLEAEPRSMASVIWNNFVGLLVRESEW